MIKKDLLKRISGIYHDLINKEGLTDAEEDVLEKLGECLDLLNGEKDEDDGEKVKRELMDILDDYVYDDRGISACIGSLTAKDAIDKCVFVDCGIDDGCDDGTNEYIMKMCYDITYKGRTFYVRFFYGDVDGIIGCYDITND